MWFGLAKMALRTGAEVYKNRQESKILNSLAEKKHLERVVAGEVEYKNTVLQSHKNDLKDEFVLVILSAPIIVLAWAVFAGDDATMEKINLFFHHFNNLPVWFQTLWITVVASIFGIKGTQIFRNGKK